MLHNIHCTFYTIQYTLYTIHYTLYTYTRILYYTYIQLYRCIGSKVTAILLIECILPTGEVALGRVCPAAFAAGLFRNYVNLSQFQFGQSLCSFWRKKNFT